MESPFELGNQVVIYGDFPYYRADSLWVLESSKAPVAQRMDVLRKRYGQRFTEMVLRDFLRRKQAVPDTVELLVLRSTEIDSQLENNPETT